VEPDGPEEPEHEARLERRRPRRPEEEERQQQREGEDAHALEAALDAVHPAAPLDEQARALEHEAHEQQALHGLRHRASSQGSLARHCNVSFNAPFNMV